ncbi:MAG: c-type cytochrome, partial [Planctomycetota bacterium]
MDQRLERMSVVMGVGLLGFVAGCPMIGDGDGGPPAAFTNADAARGGALYDKWWAVADVDAPTDDHPFWATQDTNTRTGADTWRCKECHGWDYKGVDGAYGSGSHMTGFAGIFGTTLSAQEVFDKIKDDHGLGTAGLSDADVWDLAKFVLEGQIDTDDILDGAGFTGSAAAGQPTYDSTCAACHGPDGLTPPPGHPEFDEYPGLLADENPWEVQHKIRFGQPGTAMPAQAGILSVEQVGDLGAYLQTLPVGQPVALNIDLASPGHWHVTRGKTLTFSVTDDSGTPMTGLQPTVVVKTLAGSEESLQAADNGDGTYSADYTATDIGRGYAMAYSVSFSAERDGTEYFDAWPV